MNKADNNAGNGGLYTELAASREDLRAAQALRSRVLGEEFGRCPDAQGVQLDQDLYDDHCHHLLVRNRAGGRVVGCTRILTDREASNVGGFSSASEFDLTNLQQLPGRIMEIGRTSVHPDYRRGAAIAVLWSGVAGFVALHRFDYVISCVSVAMNDGGMRALAITRQLQHKLVDPSLRVRPLLPLAPAVYDRDPPSAPLPPLLRAYLHLGAKLAGAPGVDRASRLANLCVLLDVKRMHTRYRRHFVDRHDAWFA